jgi:hypothetical protein
VAIHPGLDGRAWARRAGPISDLTQQLGAIFWQLANQVPELTGRECRARYRRQWPTSNRMN